MPASHSAKSDTLKRLVSFAAGEGWACSHTRGGHMKFTRPGSRPVFCSKTCSDHRAYLNARADLRRS